MSTKRIDILSLWYNGFRCIRRQRFGARPSEKPITRVEPTSRIAQGRRQERVPKVRIEQLEYVAAVTQHGSLRRASEELHVSQPALSEAVRSLERELGVTLLDRRRSGSRMSRRGRDLLQHLVDVLAAVDRLREAAGDQASASRMLRIGTVNAGTAALLLPALSDFRALAPGTVVEVVNAQQAEIEQGLAEGGLDLGLVNLLPGDDVPPDLLGTELVHGRPVVCCPAGHPFAAADSVDIDQLRTAPFVAMRSGYLMHRYVHRLFDGRPPPTSYSTDGAEMGKLMVARGLGVTVLPDYSVAYDPLLTSGAIVYRPLVQATTVTLLMLSRRGAQGSPTLRDLGDALLARARIHQQRHG
jgi:DNA-binding transcriptional LysR family regulator